MAKKDGTPLFTKASSQTHDAMVARLAANDDLLLRILRQAYPHVFAGAQQCKITDVKLEFPVVLNTDAATSYRGWVAGFIDLATKVRVFIPSMMIGALPGTRAVMRNVVETFFIEVKSGQIDLGDLLRQVNFYRRHKGGYWLVVSPDNRYAEVLARQDIAFVRMMVPKEVTAQ